MKSNRFLRLVKRTFPLSGDTNDTVGRVFCYTMEFLLPFLLIFFLNDVALGIQTTGKDYAASIDQVALRPSDSTLKTMEEVDSPFTITPEMEAGFVSDPDSGILEDSSYNSSYRTITENGKTKTVYCKDSIQNSDFGIDIPLSNFSCFDKDSNNNVISDFNLADIEAYKTLPSLKDSLSSISLKDKEVLLDSSFLEELGGEEKKDSLIGTTFRIPLASSDLSPSSYVAKDSYRTYTIKGFLPRTGYRIGFANPDTAFSFRMVASWAHSYLYPFAKLPDLSGYDLVDAKDILETEYRFQTDSGEETSLSSLLASSFPNRPVPFAVSSSAAREDFVLSDVQEGIQYAGSALGFIHGYRVTKIADPDKKVLVFFDHSSSSEYSPWSGAFPSYHAFLSTIFLDKLYTESRLSTEVEDTSKVSVMVPSSLLSLAGKEGILPAKGSDGENNYFSRMAGLDASSFEIKETDKEYVSLSRRAMENLFGLKQQSFTYSFTKENSFGTQSDLYLYKVGCFFLTSSQDKTIQYFQSHPEYGIKAVAVPSLYTTYFRICGLKLRGSGLIFLLCFVIYLLATILGERWRGKEEAKGCYQEEENSFSSSLLFSLLRIAFFLLIPLLGISFPILIGMKTYYLGLWIILYSAVFFLLPSVIYLISFFCYRKRIVGRR